MFRIFIFRVLVIIIYIQVPERSSWNSKCRMFQKMFEYSLDLCRESCWAAMAARDERGMCEMKNENNAIGIISLPSKTPVDKFVEMSKYNR